MSELEKHVARFLSLSSDMLSRDEFLFPYLWAQRQYREDQYQMASAAQLEDLFFDTLGTYIKQNVPGETFSRRQGKEPWDYAFADIALSHKEGKAPGLTAVWQPGEGPGNKTRLYETWDFLHPVVFVYTPKSVHSTWHGVITKTSGKQVERSGACWNLSHDALSLASLDRSTTVYARLHGRDLTVERAWPTNEWRNLSVHELRSIVGQPRPLDTDFWLDKTTSKTGLAGIPLNQVAFPFTLTLNEEPLLPGLYVFMPEQLRGIQLESNNKAHYLPKSAVVPLMRAAKARGAFVPLPLWPMEFADVTPPNLYAQQRQRYDSFMAARTR